MSTKLYIALFKTTDRGKFHWALAMPSPGGLSSTVQTFEIKNLSTGWTFLNDHDILSRDGSFVGCISLPIIEAAPAIVFQQLTQAQVAQGDTPLPYTHTEQGWSCALWLMRELNKFQVKALANFGLAKWSDTPTFYMKVCGKGIELQERTAGTIVDGVRVIEL